MINKLKQFILGMSIFWVPILGCYISGLILKMLGVD